jgi:uncharacterized membrane protein HdeD (DUF308 family)
VSEAKTGKAASGLSKIKWAYVVISVFLMALGICTFIWPEITAGTICSAMGAAAIVFGIIRIITYFMREVRGVALNYDFSIGALAVVAGIILLITKSRVVDLLQIVIGVYLVVDSVFKLQTALDAKRLGVSGWWISLILTAACLALGIVLIVKIGSNLLMVLIGAALIADGLQNLFLVIFSAAAAKALARAEKCAQDAAAGAEAPCAPDSARPVPEPVTVGAAAAPAENEPEAPKTETISDEEGDDEP